MYMCVCSPDPWCRTVYIAKLAGSSQGKKRKFIIFGLKKKKRIPNLCNINGFILFFFQMGRA